MNPKLSPAQYIDAAFDSGIKAPYLHTYVEILYRMQVHLRVVPGQEEGLQGACITAGSICKKLKYEPKTYYRHLKWLKQREFLSVLHRRPPYGAALRANWIVVTPRLQSIVVDACARAKAKVQSSEKSAGQWELPSGLTEQSIGGALDVLVGASIEGQAGPLLGSSIEEFTENCTNASAAADAEPLAKLEQDYALRLLTKLAKEAVTVIVDECAAAGWAKPTYKAARDVSAMADLMDKARKHGIPEGVMFERLRHRVRNWNESRDLLVGQYASFPPHEHGPSFVGLNGCFKQLFLVPE